MTQTEILGYFTGVTVNILRAGHQFVASAEHWERALAARPYWTSAKLALEWLYLLHPEVKSDANHLRALQLVLELDGKEPDNQKYKDLLACAYAAVGEFDRAIEVEHQAYDLPEKLNGFADRKTCLDIGLN